jgi:hypothetical protein
MKKNNIDIQRLRDQISKGLDLAFQKLIKQKKAQNGILVLSEKGQIKKIKASDLNN